MAGETILTSPIFSEVILPFVLVFTVVFAILQKSQILGKEKKQIDAIVSLSIGLIVISYANAVGIITDLMPFLAVSTIIILVFLIMYGMVFKEGEFEIGKNAKKVFGGLAATSVVIAVLILTGTWDYIKDTWFGGESQSIVVTNIIFFVILIVAVAIVLSTGKKKEE